MPVLQCTEERQDDPDLLTDCPGCEKCERNGGYIFRMSAGRPTSSHEHVFLLTKSASYFFDAEAVRESMAAASIARLSQDIDNQEGSWRANGGAKTNGPMKAVAKGNARTFRGGGAYTSGQAFDNSAGIERDSHGNESNATGSRNIRNVWTIATQPFSEAHFATFPPALVERCVKAGTSERGCCPACGAPWARVIERTGHVNQREPARCANNTPTKTDSTGWAPLTRGTNEWRQTCACPAAEPIPATVLDPFAGAGTTLLVADRLQRSAIGIELNPDYVTMSVNRIRGDAPLFAAAPG